MTDRMHAYMQTVAMHCEFTRSAREQWEGLAVFLICDPFASGFFSPAKYRALRELAPQAHVSLLLLEYRHIAGQSRKDAQSVLLWARWVPLPQVAFSCSHHHSQLAHTGSHGYF